MSARAQERARGSERKAGEEETEGEEAQWHEKEEGALRRKLRRRGEARQSVVRVVVRGRERVLPAHPRGFLSPLLSLAESTPPMLRPLSLFLSSSLSPGGGHGLRFAVGTTRATGHEPRATRACPIQHPARDDTLPSPSPPPPPSLILVLSLSLRFSPPCILSLALSLFHAPAYTHDAYDRARSRHGRWQRVRGT